MIRVPCLYEAVSCVESLYLTCCSDFLFSPGLNRICRGPGINNLLHMEDLKLNNVTILVSVKFSLLNVLYFVFMHPSILG